MKFPMGIAELKLGVSIGVNFIPVVGPFIGPVMDYLFDRVEGYNSVSDEERQNFYAPLRATMTSWSFDAEAVLSGKYVYTETLDNFEDQVSESMIDYVNLLDNEILPFIEKNIGYINDKGMVNAFLNYVDYCRDLFGYEDDDISQNLGTTENQALFVESGVLFSLLLEKIVLKEKIGKEDLNNTVLIRFGEYYYE